MRGGEFRGEAVGTRVVERLCLIDPGGFAVFVERIIDRPADAAQDVYKRQDRARPHAHLPRQRRGTGTAARRAAPDLYRRGAAVT